MGRVWIDFIHIDDSKIVETNLGGKIFGAHSLAEGATSQCGRAAEVDGPGWTRVISLEGGVAVDSHQVSGHLRGYLISGKVLTDTGEYSQGFFFEVSAGGTFPRVEALERCQLFISVEGDYDGGDQGIADPAHFAHVETSVWQAAKVKDLPGGAARKPLGDHDDFGAGILGVLPGWDSPFDEWHTFSEEIFILTGSMSTSFGVMRAGAYLSHPAGSDTNHGPVFSRDGSTMLVLRHGPIGNTYTPAPLGELERVRGLD